MDLTLQAKLKFVQFGYPAELWERHQIYVRKEIQRKSEAAPNEKGYLL